MFDCFAQASCAKTESTLIPRVTTPSGTHNFVPSEMPHISSVQGPVKAPGKKSSKMTLPEKSLRLQSVIPEEDLVRRVKLGAFVPMARGIVDIMNGRLEASAPRLWKTKERPANFWKFTGR